MPADGRSGRGVAAEAARIVTVWPAVMLALLPMRTSTLAFDVAFETAPFAPMSEPCAANAPDFAPAVVVCEPSTVSALPKLAVVPLPM